MTTFNDLFINKPMFIRSTPRICHKNDILALTIDLGRETDTPTTIKLKVSIQKETKLSNSILILPNKDKPLDDVSAQAALLGYENCHHYQRKHINLVICIEKL